MNQENFQLVGAELRATALTPQERERQKRKGELLTALQSMRITAGMNLPPLEFLFEMLGKPCFPRGELVTVSGKAKSGKTFFLSLLMAACTADHEIIGVRRRSGLPPLKCLWYDTEQSRQSTLEILRERLGQLLIPSTPNPSSRKEGNVCGGFEELYDVFNTRGCEWEERLDLLEAAIDHCHPDLVVLDGICDLVGDINDGVKVKPVVEGLMNMAQEYKCCIVNAIHQNKAQEDRNPRGWMGTELNHKSFETYACELLKPQMIFAVEQTLSRRYRMDRLLYFVVDDQGLPHPSDAPDTCAVSDAAADSRKNYPPMSEKYLLWTDGVMSVDIRNLFCDALKSGPRYYSDLQAVAMELLGCKDTGYWNKLFTDAKNQRVIVNGKNQQGKSIWMLQPKMTATTETDMFTQTDEAPPY